MARRPTIEQRVTALGQLHHLPPSADTESVLLKALSTKIGLIVEAATSALRTIEFDATTRNRLDEAAIAAFARLVDDGAKRDALCRGKLAIACLFHEAGRFVDEVFAVGVRLVQEEAIWGGKEDTASELRAQCGLAFAELYHPDAVNVLARLLADKQRNARAGAAHALGNCARPEAIPLLRFKALNGDDDVEVFSATLRALLVLDPEESVGFIGSFLDSQRTAEAAALCLGESRNAAALPILRAWATEPENLEVGYLALALLRLDEATDFLVEEIKQGSDEASAAAIAALAAFTHDRALAARVEEARQARESTGS